MNDDWFHDVQHGRRPSRFWYKLSYFLLLFMFWGLHACTQVDIVPQSIRNGQYWNAVITILAACLTFLFGLVLFLVRVIRARRWLAKSPRKYMVGPNDMPKQVWENLHGMRIKCQKVSASQLDRTRVRHSGLQNPENQSALKIDMPFSQVLEGMPALLVAEVTRVDQSFLRPRSQSLPLYLGALISHGLVTAETSSRFLPQYENSRFSGRPISESQLLSVMDAFCDLINEIQANAVSSPSLAPSDTSMQEAGRAVRSDQHLQVMRSRSLTSVSLVSVLSGSSVVRATPSEAEGDWLSNVGRQETIASAMRRAPNGSIRRPSTTRLSALRRAPTNTSESGVSVLRYEL